MLYNILLILIMPVVVVILLWRIFVTRKSNESWPANLGALPGQKTRPVGGKVVWFHAASVGQVVASLPIQREVKRMMPDAFILMTTLSQPGNAMARKQAVHADAVSFFPLDYPLFIHRALNRVRPDVFVMVEAEMWPNFLAATKRRGIPTVIVNGSISENTVSRLRRFGWLGLTGASMIDYCCMQTTQDAERVRALGARKDSIRILGNTKIDQDAGRLSEDDVCAIRADLGLAGDGPIFVAGSTNPGEEQPVLDAFGEMRKCSPNLKLIIAPRQIERSDEVQNIVETAGYACSRRSEGTDDCDVLILDTLGELASVYAVGELAFVGGSLIRKGCHSLIQPIIQGKPVLFGPYTFRTGDVARTAISAGVGFKIRDVAELAHVGGELLLNDSRRLDIEAACARLVAENEGAAARCAGVIVEAMATKLEGTRGS